MFMFYEYRRYENKNKEQDNKNKNKMTCRKGLRKSTERSTSTPDNLKYAMVNDENKLIHLDPVPQFTEKLDIKIWLQKMFFPMGIDIVIERSDKSKIIFKCKPSDYRSHEPKEFRGDEPEDPKRRVCPFRVRSTFSAQLKKWNIVIINNGHSHDLKFNPHSDEYAKFKKNLRDRNDVATLKEFEELEYKYKLNLPMESLLPGSSIISCDCGLTKEIKTLNNVYLPLNADQIKSEIDVAQLIDAQSRVPKRKPRTKTKISKQSEANKNNNKFFQPATIHCSETENPEGTITQEDLTACGINDINDYNCDKYFSEMLQRESYADTLDCNIVEFDNLDEIDFTDMFNKSKPVEPKILQQTQEQVGMSYLLPSDEVVDENLLDPELMAAISSDTGSTSVGEYLKTSTNSVSSPISPSTDSVTEMNGNLGDEIEVNESEYLNKFIDLSQVMVKEPADENYETFFN